MRESREHMEYIGIFEWKIIMNFVDVKYIGLLSSRLSHFKKKTNELYNFRCPLCGDSEKNQYKARGYLYPSKDRTSFVYKCHNCGDTRTLANLIKFIDLDIQVYMVRLSF